jgi:hypothetical protein
MGIVLFSGLFCPGIQEMKTVISVIPFSLITNDAAN